MSAETLTYLLTILSSFNGKAGVTQIVKAVFLDQASSGNAKYNFYRWYYGPYSKDIQQDLNNLVKTGAVKQELNSRGQPTYTVVNKTTATIPAVEFVQKHTSAGLDQFLKELYEKFNVTEMKMGQEFEFDQNLKSIAQSFIQ